MQAILDNTIVPEDVVVIAYEAPKGGPGMREMLDVTSAIVGAGPGESVALESGHEPPKAAIGGPAQGAVTA